MAESSGTVTMTIERYDEMHKELRDAREDRDEARQLLKDISISLSLPEDPPPTSGSAFDSARIEADDAWRKRSRQRLHELAAKGAAFARSYLL